MFELAMSARRGFVEKCFGSHRLQVEPSPFPAYCGWRLTCFGKTLAVGETEMEMWDEAFEALCAARDLNPATMRQLDEEEEDDDDLDDNDKPLQGKPGLDGMQYIVRRFFGPFLEVHPPSAGAPFWHCEKHGTTLGLSRDEEMMWSEAYEAAADRIGGRAFLHASMGWVQ